MISKIIRRTKISEWAYIVARVRVMKRKLIPEEEYPKLLNMDLNEIARYLEETEYKKEIDELAYRYSGVDLIDQALSLNLARTYRKLIRISKGLPRDLIVLYLRKMDYWNIKNVIRGKMFGFSDEEIEGTLIPAGEFDEEFFKSLIARESVEEIVEVFRGKPFYPILEKLLHGEKLSVVEDELDKFYYTSLARLSAESIDMKYFIDSIRMEIDITNVKTILRLKKEGATVEEIAGRIIPHGYQLSEDEARRLAAMDIDELVKSLEGYWFVDGVKEMIGTQPVSKIENMLTKNWAEKMLRKSHNYPLSILPVLAYMILKKVEVDNLRIIARGKESSMSVDEIKEQLVMV
ncbi:V-type ATP synthase subunit C [Geoglobus acetivorans]|uniref:A-type ATP synthase subunit C n=1 Tax=Geoglobus acetivorans TaxID=565033 RepID=A0A0A7GG08_GEOAI|nr:V-type ATP synthase subunit C [Geoglobus acetivorans]